VFTAEGGGLGARAGAFVIRPTGWGNQPSPCVPPLINPDGDTVYGNGVLATPDGKTVGEKRDKAGAVWYVPALYGPFVLAVTEMKEGQWPNEQKYLAGQLHIGRDLRPLVSLGELPELEGLADGFANGTKPVDQHVIYAPFARKLITLPANRDRLCVRAIDPKAELAKAPRDYLVVVSRPPAAVKGQAFRYAPEVWSKKGGVKLKLDAGPPGMAVRGGAVVWGVPADHDGTSADVILSVTDAAGQEVFHTFEVAVYPGK
jgi:hypothetical protein